MAISTFRRSISALTCAAVFAATAGCGEVARTGTSPVYLVIDSIEAAAGGGATFTSFLLSDVQTIVDQVPSIINDNGRASIRMSLKNIGVPTAPLGPTSLNDVTITRYRVRFIRADGRNTPGVDVPYGFDGGVTATITGSGAVQIGFELVRHTMKEEPPLSNLIGLGSARQINTIAEVTFYGHDQTGNELTVTGMITVNFSDFADPS